MSNNNEFIWTDELVMELYKKIAAIPPQYFTMNKPYEMMAEFKQSHTPKPQAENKPDWEVVEILNNTGSTAWTWVEDIKHFINNPKNAEWDGCRIGSVKRLSDGEVFSVGDEVVDNNCVKCDPSKISSFEIMGKQMAVNMTTESPIKHRWVWQIKKIPIQPQKLFITEDGVALAGQQGYVLSTDSWLLSPCNLPETPFRGDHNQFKYFHSKEAAEKYIEDNKRATAPQSYKEEQRIEVTEIIKHKAELTNSIVVSTNHIVSEEKFPKIKQAIEQVLNDEVGLLGLTVLAPYSNYNRKDLEDAFNAARKNSSYGINSGMFPEYPTFQDYFNSIKNKNA